MCVAALLLIGDRARALYAQVTEGGNPGYLSLRSDPGVPQWNDVVPGSVIHWMVETTLSDAEEGTLALELYAAGNLIEASAMRVTIHTCTMPFVTPGYTCAGVQQSVLVDEPLSAFAATAEDHVFTLATIHADYPRHTLITLRAPDWISADAAHNTQARIGVGLHASGENPQPHPDNAMPDERLPLTGGDIGALGLLAAGLLGLGAAAALRRSTKHVTQPDTQPCAEQGQA